MNPNMPSMPYGPQMPMHPSQRRHDGSYVTMTPHMRPPHGYQPYYQQSMGPMMGQYPPPYAQNWYPYPPHHMQQPLPPHTPRGAQFYPQGPPMHLQPHLQPPPPLSPHAGGQSSPRSMPAPPPPLTHRSSTGPTTTATTSGGSPSPQSSIQSGNPQQQEETSRVSSPATRVSPAPQSEAPVLVKLFHPPVPWLSVSDRAFPRPAPRQRRKIARSALGTEPVEFPLQEPTQQEVQAATGVELIGDNMPKEMKEEEPQSIPTPVQTPTPLTSDAPSEGASTQPTTPSSAIPVATLPQQQTPTQTKHSRHIAPVLPAVPILPSSPTATKKTHRDSVLSTASRTSDLQDTISSPRRASTTSASAGNEEPSPAADETPKTASPPPAPKSWADLVRSKAAAAATQTTVTPAQIPNGLAVPKTETLSDVLSEMNIISKEQPTKVALLKPRGLVNTGNMCYMNSVLQMLVFCVPFYDFLDGVARRAVHAFKSDTPMIDAMIMFMREYPTIDSAASVEQLRLRLKPDDFEKYGDSFIPEYVYQVIRQLPRFRDMRRGHQQDAQEFLGFLLEELHEECAHAIKTGGSSGRTTPLGSTSNLSEPAENESGWMEVGHRQKPAVTRSSGAIANESPVTNIFGGKLRSELKVSGNKMSVTLEPYQPLQLDIGSPQVNNIIDALKGLTRPESMQGDFQSTRGTKNTATKQVFIETLPPVLILHLKRFHYDNTTKRAEKIWKKVGYPLELEIPKEVFPTQTKNKLAAHGGLPRYRLIGVIYHHGKNANGGHYTVDIRRQDGREWIRLDDTVIRRVKHEDVAEGGSEEDPKVLAAALERHKQQKTGGNRFEQFDHEEQEEEPDKAWSQVNGHSRSKSTITTILNGTATPTKDSSGFQTPNQKSSVKDNKVAYLLFYQRISS